MNAGAPAAHLLAGLPRDEGTRLEAIRRLGESSARESVLALAHLVTDVRESARARDYAADALAALGENAAPALPVLSRAIRHEASGVRLYAGWLLQDIGRPALAAVPMLVALLADPDEPPAFRLAAARALGQLGTIDAAPERIVQSLALALGDRDEWVRLYAARTLAELGGRAAPAVSALRSALGDVYNVRRAAMFALASSGDHSPGTVDALAAALGDEQLGGLAAEALAHLGPAGLPTLLVALAGSDDRRAAFAAYGLSVAGAPEARDAATSWAASGRLPFAPTPALFYSRRPAVDMDDARAAEFGRILADAQARGTAAPITYRSRYPKYEFLDYLAHRRGLVLHGSNRRDLDVLEPRWALAQGEEADLDVIYAAKDPFTGIFFGIVDRSRVTGIRHNSFASQRLDGGSELVHEYALNADAVREGHFVPGMVYALPEGEFEYLRRSGTWVGRHPIAPVAKVPVEPADFPLLHQILGFEQIHSVCAPIRMDDAPFLTDARMYLVRPEPRPA